MSLPKKFSEAPCARCGAPERVVNPAWLRAVRLVAGISLRDTAKRLGFTPAYLCDVEKGRRHALPHIVKGYEAL